MKNITFDEVFHFIDKTPLPKVKAAYIYKNEKRKLVLGVMDFIFTYGDCSKFILLRTKMQ